MANNSKSPRFGTPADVHEGMVFKSHAELYKHDVHRRPGRGISGNKRDGADSIVMSGGYPDDRDMGDRVLYTGMRHTVDKVTQDDQSLDTEGNRALAVSCHLGKPVRVLEGLDIRGIVKPRAYGGYKYRGLYRVNDYWMTIGQQGFRICQFELMKLEPGEEIYPKPVSAPKGEETSTETAIRRYMERWARVRNTKVVQHVKQMYDSTCQICRTRIQVSPDGDAYSEAAHIQALGRPHDGEDVVENVLCLCPTCHVRFDRGVYQINDDLEVVDVFGKEEVRALYVVPEHKIGLDFIARHRARWQNVTATEA